MEKKSIGQFIAVLRKANGMTQKQLAEKLNVSDKAISRWERDQCAPDLSLITVIAEIFQVTTDELLQGQRLIVETPSNTSNREKTEKQVDWLLKQAKTTFKVRSIIAIGLGIAGLITAMICNLGFTRAYLGLLIACVFYLGAIVCESIFAVLGFSSINNSDFKGNELNQCKKHLVLGTERVVSMIAVIFASTLPLGVFPYNGYIGLAGRSWFGYGLLFAAVAALLCLMLCGMINTRIARKWDGFLSKDDEIKNEARKPIRKKYLIIFAVVSMAVFVGWYCVSASLPYDHFLQGKIFDSIDDFKEYIQLPVKRAGDTAIDDVYYNSEGQEISETEFLTHYIHAAAGQETVIDEYIHRNEEVVSIVIQWPAKGEIYIETYTDQDFAAANRVVDERNKICMALYFLLVALILLFYLWEENKVLKKLALTSINPNQAPPKP